MGQERVYPVDDTPEVHIDHPAPVFEGEFFEGGRRADAGVIDNYVYLSIVS